MDRPMKTFSHRLILITQALVLMLVIVLAGCGRTDTRVNSDPGPGRPSSADGGDKAVRPSDPNKASPAPSTKKDTGTDSTGRPSDSSGGTVNAGAGSGTSGTAEPRRENPAGK